MRPPRQVVEILSIEIDDGGRLRVYTDVADPTFQYVYRMAAEVGWEPEGYFYSPKPREWTHARWLAQILYAVRDELGVELDASVATEFKEVPEEQERAMRDLLGMAPRRA